MIEQAVASRSAPVYTLSAVGLIVVVTAALGWGASPPPPARPPLPDPVTSAEFAASVGWLTWRVVAALSVTVFVGLFLGGIWRLVKRADYDLEATNTRVASYTVIAGLTVATGIAGVVVGGGRNPDLPIAHLAWRTRSVLFTGLVAAIPWFVIAWLCQDRCRAVGHRPWNDASNTGLLSFEQLTRLWSVLVSVVGAFALGVTGALFTSGALRFAFLEAHPECNPGYDPATGVPPNLRCVNDFPAINVLLYGAVFALLGLAVALPLVWAWRSQAKAWVAATLGDPEDVPTEDWVAKRDRLEGLLNLDTPILRNPLTVLSVLTPLATSLLAAFLPQLG